MATSSSEEHRSKAHAQDPVPVAIITVSDSRTPETDVNGEYLRGAVQEAGHRVAGYLLVPDEPAAVLAAVDEFVNEARVVILNGGTGISRRDRTFEAISGRIERPLPGFGELFRMLSWEQVGSAAMLSRAAAGVYRGAILFSTPGSPAAVRLAWERLIGPELSHLVSELDR